jgi:photosystem II stability/assembly factor-like uncharacterized protein
MGLFTRRTGAALLFVAIAIVSTASAGVNTPQSGWYSGNPLLGPNALTDLACSGSTCYASGRFGTLLKSKDAGATWAGIVTGLTLDLNRVRLAGGSGDRVLVGGGCAMRRSDDGGNTFFRLPFTARDTSCSTTIVSFSFPSDNTGYLLLEGGRVLVTADGGHSFSRRTPVPGGANDLLCTAEQVCFAVGPGGLVERTADGGVSWTQVGNAGSALNSIERADPLTLYAAGPNLMVFKSVDGGASWTRKVVQDVPFSHFGRVRCGDALHCLFATVDGVQLIRTVDGGETYTSVVPSADQTFAVSFASPVRAVVAGSQGSVETSDDAGATWASAGGRIAGTFTKLAAISDLVAYAGGLQGVLARTTNAGQTWSNISPPTDAGIEGLTGWGNDRIYVLASDRSLQRSDNGGASYRLLDYGQANLAAIAAVAPARLLLLSLPNGMLRSEDGGETFQRVQDRAVRNAALDATDLAAGAVVVYGFRGAAISANGAGNWRKISLPKKRLIRDLDFATARVGFLLDTRGLLWRTVNAGRSWQPLPSLGTSAAASLQFEDAMTGYALVPAFGNLRGLGLVLRTANGGRSWHPQIVSAARLFTLRTAGSTAYALSAANALFATRVHGDIGGPKGLRLSASPRSLRKGGRVILRGRLVSAGGGENVVVSRFAGGRWTSLRVTASASGTFSTRWRVTRTSVFVAQVLGDADHAGAGTPPLTVRVG